MTGGGDFELRGTVLGQPEVTTLMDYLHGRGNESEAVIASRDFLASEGVLLGRNMSNGTVISIGEGAILGALQSIEPGREHSFDAFVAAVPPSEWKQVEDRRREVDAIWRFLNQKFNTVVIHDTDHQNGLELTPLSFRFLLRMIRENAPFLNAFTFSATEVDRMGEQILNDFLHELKFVEAGVGRLHGAKAEVIANRAPWPDTPPPKDLRRRWRSAKVRRVTHTWPPEYNKKPA